MDLIVNSMALTFVLEVDEMVGVPSRLSAEKPQTFSVAEPILLTMGRCEWNVCG